MLTTLRTAALAALALCLACRGHKAYGPPADERVEGSIAKTGSDDDARIKCAEVSQKLKEAKSEDHSETEHLQALADLHGTVRDRFAKLQAAIGRNPDLAYAGGGSVAGNLEECRTAFADVRSDLDRFVRDLIDGPGGLVVQELQPGSSKTVPVARVDFGTLRVAIASLEPDDRDALLARVETAEKRAGPGRVITGKKGKK